eukprot:gene3206-2188_t
MDCINSALRRKASMLSWVVGHMHCAIRFVLNTLIFGFSLDLGCWILLVGWVVNVPLCACGVVSDGLHGFSGCYRMLQVDFCCMDLLGLLWIFNLRNGKVFREWLDYFVLWLLCTFEFRTCHIIYRHTNLFDVHLALGWHYSVTTPVAFGCMQDWDCGVGFMVPRADKSFGILLYDCICGMGHWALDGCDYLVLVAGRVDVVYNWRTYLQFWLEVILGRLIGLVRMYCGVETSEILVFILVVTICVGVLKIALLRQTDDVVVFDCACLWVMHCLVRIIELLFGWLMLVVWCLGKCCLRYGVSGCLGDGGFHIATSFGLLYNVLFSLMCNMLSACLRLLVKGLMGCYSVTFSVGVVLCCYMGTCCICGGGCVVLKIFQDIRVICFILVACVILATMTCRFTDIVFIGNFIVLASVVCLGLQEMYIVLICIFVVYYYLLRWVPTGLLGNTRWRFIVFRYVSLIVTGVMVDFVADILVNLLCLVCCCCPVSLLRFCEYLYLTRLLRFNGKSLIFEYLRVALGCLSDSYCYLLLFDGMFTWVLDLCFGFALFAYLYYWFDGLFYFAGLYSYLCEIDCIIMYLVDFVNAISSGVHVDAQDTIVNVNLHTTLCLNVVCISLLPESVACGLLVLLGCLLCILYYVVTVGSGSISLRLHFEVVPWVSVVYLRVVDLHVVGLFNLVPVRLCWRVSDCVVCRLWLSFERMLRATARILYCISLLSALMIWAVLLAGVYGLLYFNIECLRRFTSVGLPMHEL